VYFCSMLFSQVIGQKDLKTHLINEINHDKVGHAQMFIGKPGYGGLPLALAFVQYLFCENKKKSDSCGECISCCKVQKLQHPDLSFSFPSVQQISKVSNKLLLEWREQVLETPYFDLNTWIKKIDTKERRPIISTDEGAEIIRKLALKSYEGGHKVLLMWMPEEMNTACANKLLKILEEPPKKTVFILVAESSEKILQTIISRTQIVTVPRIKTDPMSAFLQSEKKVTSGITESISARVDGDLIEAVELLIGNEGLDENKTLFVGLMRVCYKKNVLGMMLWAESVAATSNEHQKVFLKYALHMFRQSMLRNYTKDHLTKVSKEEDEFLQNFAKFITGNNIVDFMKTFNNGHYHLERNANSKILFTNLCFQVMRYIHMA